jgi:prolipoprotein diacylglyceryltransferase
MFHECRPVHPTQIYEMLAAGVAGLLAFVLVHRSFPSGVPFLAAAIVFTSVRWVIDPLRVHNATLVTAGWTYRLLYATLVAIGAVALVWRLRAKKMLHVPTKVTTDGQVETFPGELEFTASPEQPRDVNR